MGKSESSLILLSTGGTGGHVTPAQALAHDLASRGFRVEIVTDPRGQKYANMFEGLPMHVVPSGTAFKGIWGKVRGLAGLAYGIFRAGVLLRRLKPKLVVGFGGYPSFPSVYAAQQQGLPTIIHEQNAILGKANAALVNKARRVALSLPDVQGLDEAERIRAVVTGNPVRPEIAALYSKPYPKFDDQTPLRIFIMGGSLGAKVFSTVIPKALADLPADYKKRLHIIQQCREEDLEAARKAYEDAHILAQLQPFFDDVAAQLEKSHLVICRSGATTVAEVTTSGRPAIFVPYPHHKDNQQKVNADAVADNGGAWVMTEDGFTPEALMRRIETFLQDPSILFRAAEKAQACGKPDAARKLGNLVTAIVSGWKD